jgi:hypothetical protein
MEREQKRQPGQAGVPSNCCCGGHTRNSPTIKTPADQPFKLTPESREDLYRLLRDLPPVDLTSESAIRAAAFLLRNY